MKKAILLFYFLSLVLVTSAQISGRVLVGEQGVEGVAVQAYNAQNRMVANTNTSTTGSYHLSIAKGERVRVVVQAPFTLVPALRSSLVLLAQSPTVLPITQLYNPAQYTSKNPRVAVPLYLNGNHQSKATDSLPAIVLSSFSNHKTLATQLAVGTVWGLAHNNKRGLVYSSAFLKRHAGLGKAGAAGLYVSNLKTNQTQTLTQLENWNMATLPQDFSRDLAAGLLSNSKDADVFKWVGRAGLGGLDLSDDGQALYVTNLYEGTLVKLNLSNSPTSAVLAATAYKVPSNCTGGQSRPFAVKTYANKVWVGCVCDATNTQQAEQLTATVYAFDPASSRFDLMLQVPLNYPRSGSRPWQPWINDFDKALNANEPNLPSYPQPILSDIEFDPSGAMILGLMDRFGHQTGTDQPDPNGYGVYTGVAAGDVLRVAFEQPTQEPKNARQWQKRFSLEANANAGEFKSKGGNNQQGPQGGEFYNQDGFVWGRTTIHNETGAGGLALLAQTGELLHSVHEPTEAFNTAGIAIFHNQSGQKTGGFALFQNLEAGRFIKGNGVGDIEIIDEPPTTGIGNRVWHDANADGIQDPDEMPMADVALSLYQADTLVAKTLSDADGHYWFDAQNIKGGLLPETNYQIRVNEKRYDFTTGRVGQNREDLDIGLPCSECTKIVGLDTKTLVESEDTEGLAVFPNPAQKYIQVQMKADVPNETTTLIELIDLTGRPLKQQSGVFRNGQLQATVSIQDLPTGTFFVRLKTNGKANSKAVIKQN